ncbi:hypothetical protein D3C80_1063790 [compost metagenome]
MQSQAVAVEQVGFSKDERTGIDAAQGHALMVQASQPVLQCRGIGLERLEPGHHQQSRAFVQVFQGGISVDRHTVAGQYRTTIKAQDMPTVQLAAKAISHAQRLDCRNETNCRKAWQQQKVEVLRHSLDSPKTLQNARITPVNNKQVATVQELVAVVRLDVVFTA